MNSEQIEVLGRRARVHAALGDVHRLQIVDLLAISDLSSSELGAATELPSNLLAHHVKTLEDAGLVTRRRSEGDGRRTYLSLNRQESGSPRTPVPVCHCRSRAGWCSSAPPTRPAPTSPQPCGDRPAPSRPPPPEPIPANASTQAHSPPRDATTSSYLTSPHDCSRHPRRGRPGDHRLRPSPRRAARPGLGPLVDPRPRSRRHPPCVRGRGRCPWATGHVPGLPLGQPVIRRSTRSPTSSEAGSVRGLRGSGDVQPAHGARSGCYARVGVRPMHLPPQVCGFSVPG